jgi:FlaA1/EpsC-like NDP-sugar epimerase
MVLIFLAFSFSYFMLYRFDFTHINRGYYLIFTSILCFTAAPVIFKMRLHTGLLRYSNTRDMIRIFNAVLTLSILYFLLMRFIASKYIPVEIPPLLYILLINFFITSTLLIMLRILAKGVFHTLANRLDSRKLVHVLIYGSDNNAILVKQALENSNSVQYIIEGFIDRNRAHLHNYIQQKKVYHFTELSKLKATKKIDQLVIVNENLGENDKKVLMERSLRLGIDVITVPPAHNWLSGKLEKNQIQKLRIEDLLQRKPIRIDQTAVKQDLHQKRVLVTGAAGSIGSEIVRQVISYEPALLILCDQAESPLHEIQLEMEEKFPNARIEIVISDVRQHARMDKLFHLFKPQVIFHAAAYKHVPLMEYSPFEAIHANVNGTKNLADLAIAYNVEKFVMISTDKAVNPTNVMGASKRLAEMYCQALNDHYVKPAKQNGQEPQPVTRFITTRFGNVLGSNGSVIPRFRHQIEKGGPITVTHPDITRYFMTISEAVQLVLEAGTMGAGGEIFVFDMGNPVKIVDLAKKMIQLAGLTEDKDIKIVFTGLRPGEKLFEELLSEAETTLPTHHEKIRIAKVRSYAYPYIQEAFNKLLQTNTGQDNESIVRQMKELVPEFISKNSPFEFLDMESIMEGSSTPENK